MKKLRKRNVKRKSYKKLVYFSLGAIIAFILLVYFSMIFTFKDADFEESGFFANLNGFFGDSEGDEGEGTLPESESSICPPHICGVRLYCLKKRATVVPIGSMVPTEDTGMDIECRLSWFEEAYEKLKSKLEPWCSALGGTLIVEGSVIEADIKMYCKNPNLHLEDAKISWFPEDFIKRYKDMEIFIEKISCCEPKKVIVVVYADLCDDWNDGIERALIEIRRIFGNAPGVELVVVLSSDDCDSCKIRYVDDAVKRIRALLEGRKDACFETALYTIILGHGSPSYSDTSEHLLSGIRTHSSIFIGLLKELYGEMGFIDYGFFLDSCYSGLCNVEDCNLLKGGNCKTYGLPVGLLEQIAEALRLNAFPVCGCAGIDKNCDGVFNLDDYFRCEEEGGQLARIFIENFEPVIKSPFLSDPTEQEMLQACRKSLKENGYPEDWVKSASIDNRQACVNFGPCKIEGELTCPDCSKRKVDIEGWTENNYNNPPNEVCECLSSPTPSSFTPFEELLEKKLRWRLTEQYCGEGSIIRPLNVKFKCGFISPYFFKYVISCWGPCSFIDPYPSWYDSYCVPLAGEFSIPIPTCCPLSNNAGDDNVEGEVF